MHHRRRLRLIDDEILLERLRKLQKERALTELWEREETPRQRDEGIIDGDDDGVK